VATLSAFLNVTNIKQSLGFYQALGFTPTYVRQRDGVDAYAGVEHDGAEIELGWIGSNDDREYQSWVSTPLGAGVVLYLSVRDVDAVAKKAKDIGATIEYGPEDRSYGRVLGLNDPDGYVLTFIAEPKPRKKAAAKKSARKKAAKKATKKARRR
jgi:predicted enzyme related to lactoylglutathione lyase